MTTNHTALIMGATGLVGEELVKYMLGKSYYKEIKIISRRPLSISDKRITTILLEDFDDLDTLKGQMEAEHYFCLLGTTMKKAGSRSAFKKIDLIYPLKLAEIAQSFSSFRQYLIVTASGSNADSPIFYNRVKGRVEKDLRAMNLPGLKIFRPSLLLGDRNEFRLGEQIGKIVSVILSFFLVGSKKGLFSIHSKDVAKAMFMIACDERNGTEIFKPHQMIKLAKSAGI